MDQLASYAAALPEIVLALGAMALLMVGAFQKETDLNAASVGWLAIGLLVACIVLIVGQPSGAAELFDGAFVSDAFARLAKIMILGGTAAALVMSFGFLERAGIMKFEMPVLVLLATVGMMMLVSAADFIALYLGLELMSLSLYVMAAFQRDNVRSSEAGLKYFVLGALSSGMLLYGVSLIYGFTGSTSFAVIAKVATGEVAAGLGLIVGLVFLLVGLAFKVSAVPFHMWTPDVYEGAPTPVTAFFAAAPKIAAMAVLIRVLITAFPEAVQQWQQIVIFLSIASMLLGSFAAIAQSNIKRLMAYSSIANIGFALVGLAGTGKAIIELLKAKKEANVAAVGEDLSKLTETANAAAVRIEELSKIIDQGVSSVLIYLGIYIVMTLGAFACILAMRRDSGPVESIDDLAGLAQTNLGMAAAFGILLFSLAGIPPLAGFFAKFYVFKVAIDSELYTLAIIGVLASVVGAYYYLRIVKVMFFDAPKEGFLPIDTGTRLVMGVSAVLVILYVVVGSYLENPAISAAKSLSI